MINGQNIIKGGNWISSDLLLRLSPKRYEAEVKMHAQMNMNMIRVWGDPSQSGLILRCLRQVWDTGLAGFMDNG